MDESIREYMNENMVLKSEVARTINENPFVLVVTNTLPYQCVVEKVLIEEGMTLKDFQPVVLVKARIPSTFTTLGVDTSSEHNKLWCKKDLDAKSRVSGIYHPIHDVVVPAADDDDYGKQDDIKIEKFKRFDTVIDHSDHLFSSYIPPAAMLQSDWANTIKEERRILEQQLPDTIFVRVYEPRMDLMRAAIVGPEGTPYQDGLFFFDLLFPNDYPNSPPHVRYHSCGLGINPNLKTCGEVCLSLFDTALKEERLWVPGTNILNLLICIQTLIFNPKPFFNCNESMRGTSICEFLALLYNENTIVKSLMTMAHTMNKPPKNFEDLVVGHFRKCLPDILRSCKAYMEGLQVGCLVNVYKHICSLEFKNEVASCINPLVESFNKIGANETEEFLHLIEEKNIVVDNYMDDGLNKKSKDSETCHDGSDYYYAPWEIRTPFPGKVVKVLVKEGMKLEPGQPLYHNDRRFGHLEDTDRLMASRPRPESATRRILELNHSSRIGIFSMEDVPMDQDGDNPESSQLAVLHKEEALSRYKNFNKFAFVTDHADHFYSAHNCAMNQIPEDWAGKMHEELRILEEQLPETIYVRAYESRMDLLRAVIIGPDGTPYQGGLFFFDVHFPSNYPDSPPLVHYHSGGLGINPNLFKCGEVRLNVPTKSGGCESMWVPGTTTMLQLLVSIQNRILTADPLFNEPAYATMKGSYGKYASFLYKETAYIKSLKTMMYIINKPPKNFEEFVAGHFRNHGYDIMRLASENYSKKPYSRTLMKDLGACIKPLVAAFNKTMPKEKEIQQQQQQQATQSQHKPGYGGGMM